MFRIRSKVLYFVESVRATKRNSDELVWAEIFHDSIRGRDWLESLSLSPGRWAANYSMLYLLFRALSGGRPNKILEMGLGESSKLVSRFLENELVDSTHLIAEHDTEWMSAFHASFEMSDRSRVQIFELVKQEIKGYESNSYQGIVDACEKDIELYIVDGPFGSPKFSRFDVVELIKARTSFDDFAIILDDFQREGERHTVRILKEFLDSQEVNFVAKEYAGAKKQYVIATGRFRFLSSV
jgi:hypothetical protein